jgi:DNA-directed RNA polymerase subunit RPC12/RpoP
MSPSVKNADGPETPASPVAFPCSECGKRLKVRAALAGKKVKCPECGHSLLVPGAEPEPEVIEVVPEPEPAPARRFSILAMITVATVIFGCAIWANLSFAVTNKVNLKYFPPFKAYVDVNDNHHLGAEYYSIARAMAAGRGFANPFNDETGPTAWMPPVLPTILAALIWVSDGDKDIVMAIVVFMQVYTLVGTGLLVLLVARKTTTRLWAGVAALAFVIAVISDFHSWFQSTHDCWLILAVVDLVVAGFVWFRPLSSWQRATLWGVFGGLCALVNPIIALCWAIGSLATMVRERAWKRLVIAALVSMLTISPWIVRNYLVFGRLIPVKSNLAYELWQSQRKSDDGVLKGGSFGDHPWANAHGIQRRKYKEMKEIPYLDEKKALFTQMVRDDPLEFADRVAARFFAATLWYTPFNRNDARERPWTVWTCRAIHPLPFLAAIAVLFSAFLRPLSWVQVMVIGIYFLYLMPYVGVSYYGRYAIPLLAVKVILVIWAADRLLCLVLRDKATTGDSNESV